MHIANKKCNLCGSIETEIISEITRYEVPAKSVICRVCGLVFIDEETRQKDLRQYYDEKYRKQYVSQDLDSQSYQDQKVNQAKKLIEKGIVRGNVLEIGCANGVLLLELKKIKKEISIFGVEPTRDIAEQAEKSGVNVFCDFVENYEDNETKFDLIIIDHVLEHFQDPKKVILKLKSILKEDGTIFIEVPDILEPYHDLEHLFFQHVHLYNFSARTLTALLKSCGFKFEMNKRGVYIAGVATIDKEKDLSLTEKHFDNYKEIWVFLELYKNLYRYKMLENRDQADKCMDNILKIDLGMAINISSIRQDAQVELIRKSTEDRAEHVNQYLQMLGAKLPEIVELIKLGIADADKRDDKKSLRKLSNILKWTKESIEKDTK